MSRAQESYSRNHDYVKNFNKLIQNSWTDILMDGYCKSNLLKFVGSPVIQCFHDWIPSSC